MRIHVIRAQTLPAALHQVRETYGEDAIVLDTAEGPNGVAIRVGVELPDGSSEQAPQPDMASEPMLELEPEPALPAVMEPKPGPRVEAPPARPAAQTRIAEALTWHGATPLAMRSLMLAVEADGHDDPETALAAALERVYRFAEPESLPAAIAFVGPPGSGKTATLAKLAAARSLAEDDVAIVNADLETAGAPERIGAFAAALGLEPYAAENADAIASAIAEIAPETKTFVDTNGRAPADEEDVSEIAAEIAAAGDGVVVLSAAIAPVEAAELAESFAAAGADYLIMTQLDIARRIGALLAAADAGALTIAGVSVGRRVGDGLKPLTPQSLARLILAPPRALAKPRPRDAGAIYQAVAAVGRASAA